MRLTLTSLANVSRLPWNAFCPVNDAQQEEGDQRDGDLRFDGIFARAEEAVILRCCLTQRKNSSIGQRTL